MAKTCEEYVLEELKALKEKNEMLEYKLKKEKEEHRITQKFLTDLNDFCQDINSEIVIKDETDYYSLYLGKTYIGLIDRKYKGYNRLVQCFLELREHCDEQTSIKSES